MDVETDSRTSVPELQFIEKKFSRISVTWNICLYCIKGKTGGEDKLVSHIFRFSNKYWQLTSYFSSYISIGPINLKCFDTNPTSTCTINLHSITISDEQGIIIKEILGTSDVLCFGQSSSQTIVPENIYIGKKRSVTVSINMCAEENIRPTSQERINEENKDILMSCDSKLSFDFEELYENRQFSDVVLKLGEKEFPAHKSVLSARSKVFAARFEHDTKKNRQGTVDLVQMEADTFFADTVQDMLRYIYCGKIRRMSVKDALDLYEAADCYDLPELRDICREVAVRGISPTNVLSIAAAADIYNDELIISELISFISRNGANIINTEEWKEMYTEDPSLGTKILEWLLRGKKC